jgi:hypothetical protein
MEKIIKKLKIKSIIFDLITILIFSIKIPLSECNCDLNTPIKKSGTCQLIYCTEDEFKSEVCVIDNEIIKTQWLTNIIYFNDNKFRYCSVAVNSQGDIVVEFSTEEDNGIRLFYGLKKDGNFLFKDSDDSETPINIISIKKNNETSIRYESQNIFVSLYDTNDNNEYLMSVSLYFGNVELYDLESNAQSFVETKEFTGYVIYATSYQLIKLNSDDNKNKYLLLFIGQRKDDVNYQRFYLILQIYTFSKKNIDINDGYTIEKAYESSPTFSDRAISGYTTDSNLIVIFYFDR